MRRPTVAVIGDLNLHNGELTDAGSVAIILSRDLGATVGLRSVACDATTKDTVVNVLESNRITSWVTCRNGQVSREAGVASATVRMGDPLDIAALFGHDVVVLAMNDLRLRRFLADLPVHTSPDVRILASIHIPHALLEQESLDDLLRFDVLAGAVEDFALLLGQAPEDPMTAIHARMRGTNLRGAVAWTTDGSVTIASLDGGVIRAPAQQPRLPLDDQAMCHLLAVLAFDLARRTDWSETAVHCRDNMSDSGRLA